MGIPPQGGWVIHHTLTIGAMKMIKMKVTGMTCDHCVKAVTEALSTVPGVERVVEVSRERGEAIVEGHPVVEQLVAAVTEEGYQAEMV